jgi:multidrug efflux pump subunit AcrA (membrane-fusion protein)
VRFRDRWFLVLASAALVAIIGTGGYFLTRSKAAPPPKPIVPAAPPEPAVPTGTEVTFSGTLQARNLIPVPAPIDGTLEALEVEEGDEVAEEQLLGRLRNEGLAAAKEQAQQELEQMQSRVQNLESSLIAARLEASRASADSQRAQAEFERVEKAAIRQQLLYKEGATARLTYEKAQKDLELATSERDSFRTTAKNSQDRIGFLQRDLDNAKKALEERSAAAEEASTDLKAADILAPVDGLLMSVNAKLGEQVPVEMKDLFVIAVAPEELEVLIEPDSKTAERIPDGAPALVQILELSLDVEGKVARDEDGRIHVEFDAKDRSIKPGLAAVVKIRLP